MSSGPVKLELPVISVADDGRLAYLDWRIEERPGTSPRYVATSPGNSVEVRGDMLISEVVDRIDAISGALAREGR